MEQTASLLKWTIGSSFGMHHGSSIGVSCVGESIGRINQNPKTIVHAEVSEPGMGVPSLCRYST